MADLTRICTNIKDLSKMVNFYIVNLKKNLTNPQETVVQWFESYKAFISYNKRSMTKMDISIKRALLSKCLDTKLVSALRTHKDVTPTTEIDTPSDECLAKPREIFLEKNPHG